MAREAQTGAQIAPGADPALQAAYDNAMAFVDALRKAQDDMRKRRNDLHDQYINARNAFEDLGLQVDDAMADAASALAALKQAESSR